ncbi:MAG: pilus assembly protein PilC [Naasia sp.]|jgi:type IV pilus assembly protein PilC|uniref:type II secretion system F family protein n=1 Tax=Naasia sp. TaxID=2546198 RepID=UPI00263768A3|nr:type II secretion system F family protein [Naasia sp.]MCU1570080.1 pilus assembly protein PilC [Naasia sp.]
MSTTAVRTYVHRSRNSSGKLIKGKLDAPSESAALGKLRTMGLAPVAIGEWTRGTGLQREIEIPGLSKGVGLKDLAVVSRQLATMLSAGLSLLRTLTILGSQTDNKKLAGILAKVTEDVETGTAFSVALAAHPKVFPPLMINMIRAGETGGFLDSALASIATNFEKEAKLRAQIKSAMTYPVMVLLMSLVAVIAMLLFIVPVFQNMFEGLGGQLPLPTMALVVLSQNMVWALPLLLVITVAGGFWWRANKHKEAVRKLVDPVKLKMPVFGALATKIAVARFTRNFSDMIGAGVPILTALNVVGSTSGNWVLETAAHNMGESVRQGRPIAEQLAQEKVFPPMVTQMVAVGEDSGALETMLLKVSEFYDAEIEATTAALTSLIEPLLIAFLGVVVGGMIVALYMPIFNIATLVH